MMNSELLVGIIQTSLDHRTAWQSIRTTRNWRESAQISVLEENRAVREILHFLATMQTFEKQPDIVLLPELSVPLGFEKHLRKIAEEMKAVIIAGLDYRITNIAPPTVTNEAVMIFPRRLRGEKVRSGARIQLIGKTYPAPEEQQKLKDMNVAFEKGPVMRPFESATLGRFSIVVCYDFLDLNRISAYKNEIQTLFILAYNRDTTSFYHAAENIARTVFCNVVICNCGFYGGSLAVTPYKEAYRRTVYQHAGEKLENAQVISLPLRSLEQHQSGVKTDTALFKNLPPGYSSRGRH